MEVLAAPMIVAITWYEKALALRTPVPVTGGATFVRREASGLGCDRHH
jgi:hypothetical protein